MDSITLSGNEFRALSSETRVSIIKLLQERNRTLTELAGKTNLAAPTVKQHLEILEKADLVQQVDEGRKWKYYCITRKGKNLFASEGPKNILIVLATSIIALGIVLYSFLGMIWQSAFLQPLGDAQREMTDKTLPAVVSGASCEVPNAIAQACPLNIEQAILYIVLVAAICIAMGFAIGRAKRK